MVLLYETGTYTCVLWDKVSNYIHVIKNQDLGHGKRTYRCNIKKITFKKTLES